MDKIYSLKIIQVDWGWKNIPQAQTIPGTTRPGVAKKSERIAPKLSGPGKIPNSFPNSLRGAPVRGFLLPRNRKPGFSLGTQKPGFCCGDQKLSVLGSQETRFLAG